MGLKKIWVNILRNKQWHYWNIKHNHPYYYNYDNVNICDPLLTYINQLDNINSFLDHGCGHGRISKIIQDKFPLTNVTINDIIPLAIKKSQAILQQANLHTVIGQLHHVSGKYDCIISHRVIHSCPNYRDIFREFYRLLSEDATCFLSVRSIDCIQKETHKEWFDPNTNIIYRSETGKFTKLFEVDEFQQLLISRGLKIIRHGKMTELSAKTKKNNQYLYAVCSRQKQRLKNRPKFAL